MAFKQRAGVLKVPFGVGLGGGEASKRFVEHADDPLLFGERGCGELIVEKVLAVDLGHPDPSRARNGEFRKLRGKEVMK